MEKGFGAYYTEFYKSVEDILGDNIETPKCEEKEGLNPSNAMGTVERIMRCGNRQIDL